MNHKFPCKWSLSDGYPAPGIDYHGAKVFSCFACGGGSTMGYKLAGFDVIGANDIDPKMAEVYKANHNPKHYYLESITTLKDRDDFPPEMYDLDILDGSPPCSSFSMAGSREKGWGKEKKFREGQAKQVLDTLFFDFIELANKLRPKVVIAENVKGIILGDAIKYVARIREDFEKAGYYMERYLLDASKMGVPQRRERVFFIAVRKDICPKDILGGLFGDCIRLDMKFSESDINYGEYRQEIGDYSVINSDRFQVMKLRKQSDDKISDINEREFGKLSGFNAKIIRDNSVMNTITSSEIHWRDYDGYAVPSNDYILAGSFPFDYNFKENKPKYLIGMSVPPVMSAQVAHRVKTQILDKIRAGRPGGMN